MSLDLSFADVRAEPERMHESLATPTSQGASQIYGEKVSWPSLVPTRRRVPDSVWWLSQLMKFGTVGRCLTACAVISSA
jgi:hypothetical protein